jgi:hypothetical protein
MKCQGTKLKKKKKRTNQENDIKTTIKRMSTIFDKKN